jgi:2-iminobutanoate/2-iminopropanoate deaminase
MESIFTEDAPYPVGAYSQAVRAGNTVYFSGQIAIDPKTNKVMSDAPVAMQAEQCLRNLKAVMDAADIKKEQIAKVSIFLTKMEDFSAVNEVYERFFGEHKPARACVAVYQLPKLVSVEIEAIAVE